MRSANRVVLPVFIALFTLSTLVVLARPVVTRTVVNPAPPITVTSPRAGESYKSGFPITVSWTYSGNVGQTVRILLHKNSAPAGDKVLLSWSLDGSGAGSCGTKIPKDAVPGNDYTIVVESNQNPAIKGRSGLFTLVDGTPTASIPGSVTRPGAVRIPLIVVNKPAAGEQWQHGTSYPIAWTNKSANNAFRAVISLLRGTSGDAVQKTIASNALISQGSFNWIVTPDVPPGQYRIHIRGSGSDENIFGTGEAFTIVKPGITAEILPLGRQLCQVYINVPKADEHFTVSWKYTGVLGNFVTITWLPYPGQQVSRIIIESGVSIGSNGAGEYEFNPVNWNGMSNLRALLKSRPNKALDGYIQVDVIGTKFSANGGDLSFRLVDK